MSRLRKLAESQNDDMSFDEVKDETLRAISNMENKCNEWSVRDALTQFTEWGFYKGQMMASIDAEMGAEICDQLRHYVDQIPEFRANDLYEIYDIVGRYGRF